MAQAFVCDGPNCTGLQRASDHMDWFFVLDKKHAKTRHFCTTECMLQFFAGWEPVVTTEMPGQ